MTASRSFESSHLKASPKATSRVLSDFWRVDIDSAPLLRSHIVGAGAASSAFGNSSRTAARSLLPTFLFHSNFFCFIISMTGSFDTVGIFQAAVLSFHFIATSQLCRSSRQNRCQCLSLDFASPPRSDLNAQHDLTLTWIAPLTRLVSLRLEAF